MTQKKQTMTQTFLCHVKGIEVPLVLFLYSFNIFSCSKKESAALCMKERRSQ
jgi:hypothetical protein